MNIKQKVKEFATQVTKRGPQNLETRIMHPEREWLTGIFIGLILFTLGVWWSFYTYSFYNANDFVMVDPVEQVIVYRASMVETANEYILSRSEKFQSLTKTSESVSVETQPAPPTEEVEFIVEEESAETEQTEIQEIENVEVEADAGINDVTPSPDETEGEADSEVMEEEIDEPEPEQPIEDEGPVDLIF